MKPIKGISKTHSGKKTMVLLKETDHPYMIDVMHIDESTGETQKYFIYVSEEKFAQVCLLNGATTLPAHVLDMVEDLGINIDGMLFCNGFELFRGY